MHRGLSIPEILMGIFQCLEPGSNARNARVCRQWSDPALDETWRVAEPDVFSSLAPMRVTRNGPSDTVQTLSFITEPTAEQWARFLPNSRRVRSFNNSPTECSYLLSHHAAFDIAITRPNQAIFQNLRSLFIIGRDQDALFMSETLVHLHLIISSTSFSRLVRSVRDKASHVKSLRIKSYCSLPRHETDLVELLRSLQHLEYINLPLGYFSTNLARELQHHKSLKVITQNLSLLRMVSDGEEQFPSSVPSPLDPNAFPSLEILAFSTDTISNASAFLTPTVLPSHRLEELWLHIASHPQPKHVEEFLNMLSESFTSLQILTLDFFQLNYDADDEEAFNGLPVLMYRDFLPLLRFKQLAQFEITHPYPIEMNDQQAAELASRWPHLARLSLNPRPLIPSKTSLSLSAFLSFVIHCPSLWSIGLYVDATLPVPAEPVNIRPHDVLDICVGRSALPLDSNAPTTFYPKVARFLSTYLVPRSQWDWPNMSTEFYPHVEGPSTWLNEIADYPKVEEYEQAWKCIQGMTSLILEERLKASRLSEALTKLRKK